MILIESFIQSKNKDFNLCEDNFVITDDYIVVIDGATAKTNKKYDGVSSGKYISDLMTHIIKDTETGLDKSEFIRHIEKEIRENYQNKGWLDSIKHTIEDRPSATLAIYSKTHNQIWLCGDSSALVIINDERFKKYNNDKKIDSVMANARKIIIELELAKGTSISSLQKNDVGREYIMPLLSNQQFYQNNQSFKSELNYTVIDGFDCDLDQVKEIDIINNASEIVLGSDGYAKLLPTLKQTENRLISDLKKDPLCINELLSTKCLIIGNNSFDDRTYVRFKLEKR